MHVMIFVYLKFHLFSLQELLIRPNKGVVLSCSQPHVFFEFSPMKGEELSQYFTYVLPQFVAMTDYLIDVLLKFEC